MELIGLGMFTFLHSVLQSLCGYATRPTLLDAVSLVVEFWDRGILRFEFLFYFRLLLDI